MTSRLLKSIVLILSQGYKSIPVEGSLNLPTPFYMFEQVLLVKIEKQQLLKLLYVNL